MKILLATATLLILWTTGLAQKADFKIHPVYLTYCNNLKEKNITNNSMQTELILSDSSRWQKGWNRHPNRKIIVGSAYIICGGYILSEGIGYVLNPNDYDGYSNKNLAMFQAISGSAFLTFGGFCIIKGISLKRQSKLKVGMTNSGVGVIYKI